MTGESGSATSNAPRLRRVHAMTIARSTPRTITIRKSLRITAPT